MFAGEFFFGYPRQGYRSALSHVLRKKLRDNDAARAFNFTVKTLNFSPAVCLHRMPQVFRGGGGVPEPVFVWPPAERAAELGPARLVWPHGAAASARPGCWEICPAPPIVASHGETITNKVL